MTFPKKREKYKPPDNELSPNITSFSEMMERTDDDSSKKRHENSHIIRKIFKSVHHQHNCNLQKQYQPEIVRL